MKIYLHYAEGEDKELHSTIKLTLPKSWRTGPSSQLLKILVDDYNKKSKSLQLDASVSHLELTDGTELPSDGVVDKFVENGADIYLKSGPSRTMEELGVTIEEEEKTPKKTETVRKSIPLTPSEIEAQKKKNAKVAAPKEDGKVMCKRFGCQKKFDPNNNEDNSCRHHIKPPIFHETRKYWACCPDSIAWDWDSFQAIPGCAVSNHSDVREGKSFLGGSDVREKVEKSGPQRIDQPKTKKRELTALDKISNLRKALSAAGIQGLKFDDCRDRLKSQHEDLGVKVWDKVLEEMVALIDNALNSA